MSCNTRQKYLPGGGPICPISTFSGARIYQEGHKSEHSVGLTAPLTIVLDMTSYLAFPDNLRRLRLQIISDNLTVQSEGNNPRFRIQRSGRELGISSFRWNHVLGVFHHVPIIGSQTATVIVDNVVEWESERRSLATLVGRILSTECWW